MNSAKAVISDFRAVMTSLDGLVEPFVSRGMGSVCVFPYTKLIRIWTKYVTGEEKPHVGAGFIRFEQKMALI